MAPSQASDRVFRWLATCLLALLLFASANASVIDLSRQVQSVNLVPQVELYVDRSAKLTFEEIMGQPDRYRFEPTATSQRDLNFGFSSAAYWIKFSLVRQPDAPETWLLEIPFLGLDHITLYEQNATPRQSGSLQAIEDRPIFTRFYTFPIRLSTEPKTYYLRVASAYAITIPLTLYRVDAFSQVRITDTLVQGLYFGGLISLFFYNLVLLLLIRDKRYFLYCCFTLSVGLAIFAGNGLGRLYLWPASARFDQVAQSMLFALAASLAVAFTCQFLNTRSWIPRMHRVLVSLVVANGLIAMLLLLSLGVSMPLPLLFTAQFLVGSISSAIALGASVYISRQGYAMANYFNLSWGFLCVGGVVASLRAFEILPDTILTLYAIQIGSGFEALLFSFALAHRFRVERAARERSERQATKARQMLVDSLRQSQQRLEALVSKRTEELQKLVVSEQKIREQYVRFGAMIAHEFRNPLSIIEAQNTMIEMESSPAADKLVKRVGVIRGAVSRLALLFDQWLASDKLNQAITQVTPLPIDVTKLLAEVFETSRTYHVEHRLSLTLQETTLVIPADYHLLQLGLLNLIDNACKYSPKGTSVELGLCANEHDIGLYVRDQGPGIADHQQRAVFEAYVRLDSDLTKKGVGLGLAFVKQIAELHRGRAEIRSVPGEGATFFIWLPRPA